MICSTMNRLLRGPERNARTLILLLKIEFCRLADASLAADLGNRCAFLALIEDERLLRVLKLRCLHVIALLSQPGHRSGKLQLQAVQFAGIRSASPAKQSSKKRISQFNLLEIRTQLLSDICRQTEWNDFFEHSNDLLLAPVSQIWKLSPKFSCARKKCVRIWVVLGILVIDDFGWMYPRSNASDSTFEPLCLDVAVWHPKVTKCPINNPWIIKLFHKPSGCCEGGAVYTEQKGVCVSISLQGQMDAAQEHAIAQFPDFAPSNSNYSRTGSKIFVKGRCHRALMSLLLKSVCSAVNQDKAATSRCKMAL